MNRIKICLLTCLLNIVLAASNNLDITTWAMDSGMQVAFVSEHNKIVNIRLVFDAGASRDNNNYGIANITSNLLELGSKGMSAKEIAESFENVGAIFGSSTYKDFSSLSLQTLSAKKYFVPATSTFIKVASTPTFPEEEITRLKDQIITGIKLENESPHTMAVKKFFASIYNTHPYGHASAGTEETVNAITKSQISDFYNTHYNTANAKLIIVGDLSIKEAENLANKINSSLPKGITLEPIASAEPNHASKNNIYYPSKQSSLVFGHVAIGPNDPDYYALTIAGYILGGGMDSRLSSVIREEKGLVYNVSSYFIPLKAHGAFVVTLQTKAESTAEATAATTPVIAKFIKDGVTEEELETAKNVIITSYFDNFTTNSKIASAIAQQLIYDRAKYYLNNYADNIRSVTLDEINSAIKKHMLPTSNAYVTVGPKITEL